MSYSPLSNILATSPSVTKGLALAFTLALLILSMAARPAPVRAASIEIDLDDQSTVELHGPWEFYWKEFLDPQAPSLPQPTASVDLPGSWTYIRNGQSALPAEGYGTYRAVLSLQESGHDDLMLRIPMVYSAYKLFVNGSLAAQVGTPGDSAELSIPDYGEQLVHIPYQPGEIELIFHVSNFTSRNAGFPYPMELGQAGSIFSALHLDLISKAALAGGLLLIGLARLTFFIILRRELTHLFFGLAVFSTSLHIIISERFLDFLGWHLPIHLARPIDGLTVLIAGTAYLQFLAAFFPKHLPIRLIRWGLLTPVLYLAAVFVLPDMLRSQLIGWLLYLVVGSIGLSLIAVVRAWLQRLPDAGLILAASGSIFAAGFLQIVQFNETGIRSTLVDIAVLISVLLYNFALARRYARAFEHSKKLESALGRANRLKDEFLTNTSHELRTPLHAMIGLAESLPRDNEALARGLDLIADSGRRLGRLVDDILALTRLNHGDMTLDPSPDFS